MPPRTSPSLASRKSPRQARAAALVDAVLAAAVQVLADEGAARFTMARVAERAGASVGSLYQYFPNKAAILFRLQSDEWAATSGLLATILTDDAREPKACLRAAVEAFIASECAEAAVRGALDDAAPLYRDAPEARDVRAASDGVLRAFMTEALPAATDATRDLAATLIKTTLTATAKAFSERPRTPDEVAAFAGAMADMFDAWLDGIDGH